jgi:hypothetical protein
MQKKRRKPWYRPRNVVLVLLAVFLVWAGSWIRWALTVEPNPTVDYAAELEQLSAAAQPPGEDAWPHLQAAMAILDRVELAFPLGSRPIEHERGFDHAVLDDPEASPESVALLGEVIAWLQAEGAYEHLARTASCPRMVRPLRTDGGMLLAAHMDDLASARMLAKWRMVSARLALEDGHVDDALDAFEQTMALGRLYTWQPTIIDTLIARAIIARARSELTFALMERQFDRESLSRIIDLLDEDGRLGPIQLQLEGERRFFLDLVQRIFSEDADGDGVILPAFGDHLDPTAIPSSPPADPEGLDRLTNLLGPFFPSRREIVDRMGRVYDALEDMAAMPFPARGAAHVHLQMRILDLGSRFRFLSIPIPSIGKTIDQCDVTTCNLRGLRLLAAIELYRVDRGHYPASLDDLVPSILPELLIDPVSGLPFVYRTLEDDPYGRGFLLYTVGVDGADDGAKKGLANGHALMREYADDVPGIDYIINLPREVADPG